MNGKEFSDFIKSNNVKIIPPFEDRELILTNAGLQKMRAAILPNDLIELYKKVGGFNLNGAYVFGPKEFLRQNTSAVPSIMEINKQLTDFQCMRGKTVFARNDLFWFAFDVNGEFFMLDNLTLKPLKKYDNLFNAICDCLTVGRLK